MTIKASPGKTKLGPAGWNTSTDTGNNAATDKGSQPEIADTRSRIHIDPNAAPASAPAVDPDRENKIADLKHQIRAGEYQPDLEKVAESLLNHIMEDKR